MMTTRRSGAVLGLALAMMSGCGSISEPDLESLDSPPTPPEWDPHPINPQLCHNQEGPPPTPPQSGHCDIEVRLDTLAFSGGQGVSEGKGEIRGIFTADPQDGPNGAASVVAVSPQQDYSVGQVENANLDLGTYRVDVGDTLDVEICASIVEDDRNGANAGDDYAKPCTTVTLSCGAQVGQEPFTQPLGPTAFCEADGSCNGSAAAMVSVKAADADMDNIPNDDDFTPDMCDEELKGTGGIALLLYFHYDDNGLITLGQSALTNLVQVYGAYDYVVLVADNETSNPGNFSGPTWSNADRVFPPTRQGLLDAMQHLTSEHYRFDTFVHAHGYKNGADDSEFETWDEDDREEEQAGEEDDEDDLISGNWLVDATQPDLIGTAEGGIPIIAWWSTTCIAVRQIDAWLTRGAITASGAVDVQFYPNAWGDFATNWIGGQAYFTAVDTSVTPLVVARAETLINIQGSAPPWWCTDANTVLADNACADDFFVDTDGDDDDHTDDAAYNIWEVYDDTLPGAENMEISSTRWYGGNTNVTFGGGAHVWP